THFAIDCSSYVYYSDLDEDDDDQDGEDHHPDDEIAAHHEIAEGLDDVAGGVGAVVSVGEDETRRGEVERQPHHRGDEQHGGETREFERRLDEQRRHQDQDREDDRDGEQRVEQQRRQRQDEDDDERHDADGEADVGRADGAAHAGEAGQLEPWTG